MSYFDMIDKRLFSEVKGNKKYKTLVVVNGTISFIASFFQAMIIAIIVNDIFIRHEVFAAQSLLFSVLLGIILSRALIQFLLEKALRFAAIRIKADLQQKAVSAMLEKGPSDMNRESTGAKMMAVCEAADTIDPYYHEFLPQLVTVCISVPLILIAVVFRDVLSFFIMLLTAPLLPVFLALIGMASAKLNASRLGSLQRLGGSFLDTLNGMKTLKLFGQSKNQSRHIHKTSEDFRKTTMEVLKVSFLSAFVLELAATISTAIIAVSLGLRLMYGRMEFFDAFFILLLAPEYYLPIRQLGARFHTAMTAKAAADKIFELTEGKKKNKNESGAPIEFKADNGLNIEFENVKFSYENTEMPALNGVNLSIPSNKTIALVGKSGSGKSTVAAALLRFIEIDSGDILINGRSIKDIPVDSLRSMIAYIPQKPFIFNDTVFENIRFSKPYATIDEVRAAAEKAAAHEFIKKLPDGYDTLLSEGGSSISQGEAQRIAIARTLLRNAPLVILDEATSALDEENQEYLRESFAELGRDRALLIIAHRLETVADADCIYVMENGEVLESGTQKQLVEKDGLFKGLVDVWGGMDEAAI